MRYVLSLIAIVALFSFVLIPKWNQSSLEHIASHQSKSQVLNLPEKIDFINQVDQTVESLNNSSHITTIHHNSQDKSHAVKNEVTIKFKKNPDKSEMATIHHDIDGKVKKQWDSYCIFKSKTKSTEDLIAYFLSRSDVEFAEPNFLLLPNKLPDDPLYKRYQWNLPSIKAEQAWDISQGKPGVIVAIVDTGVDTSHEEFKDKLVPGYNVLMDTNNPMDDNGHGTHVAGIISANTNNNVGVAGVSWNNQIMPVKAIGAEGAGSSFDIAKGIKWATDHGARVINMSVGNYHPSAVLEDAIHYAYNKGVVMVAASGNDNTNQPSYPASYPEVLSIAAVDDQQNRATFSNFGDSVGVAAPGVDIASTYIYNEYAALSGTSMACPHVAGLAGLILSVNPSLTNKDVVSIIEQSATDLGDPGKDPMYGYGLININKALQMATAKTEAQPTANNPSVPAKSGFLHNIANMFGL
ncbi:MAG TPA: S8 family peptidase [Bacillota bacterium]|nr:S8 family peptidase [Bacillota bacterium]